MEHGPVIDMLWGWLKEIEIDGERIASAELISPYQDGAYSFHLRTSGEKVVHLHFPASVMRQFEGLVQKPFYTLDEVAQAMGVDKATVWAWIHRLSLPTHKFVGTRNTHLAAADAARLIAIKKDPSQAGEKRA